ncbi:MAG: DUF4142 domain-containing protein [Vulcanimicrobiota bacterium]
MRVHYILVCLALVMPFWAAAADDTHLSTEKLIHKADEGNRAEIELANLALKKSNDKEVQQLAGRIIDDHREANETVKQLAKEHGVKLNEGKTKAHKDLHARLSSLQGEEFDREYIKAMAKAHQKDIDFYNQQAKSAPHESLRDYFSHTAPVLNTHLAKVKEIQTSQASR